MALPVRIERGHLVDPMDLARNDVGSMLSRLFSGGLFGEAGDASALAPLAGGVDIREDADHIYVDADLPGFRKEDVDISLENGTLTIVAEKQEEIEEPPPQEAGQEGQAAAAEGQQRQGDGKRQRQRQRQGEGGARGGQQDTNYLLRERRVQRVVRSFTLPPNVDEQNVQARMENGVLKIVLNKKEESKPKRIQVS
jgi:HSP20 family protein